MDAAASVEAVRRGLLPRQRRRTSSAPWSSCSRRGGWSISSISHWPDLYRLHGTHVNYSATVMSRRRAIRHPQMGCADLQTPPGHQEAPLRPAAAGDKMWACPPCAAFGLAAAHTGSSSFDSVKLEAKDCEVCFWGALPRPAGVSGVGSPVTESVTHITPSRRHISVPPLAGPPSQMESFYFPSLFTPAILSFFPPFPRSATVLPSKCNYLKSTNGNAARQGNTSLSGGGTHNSC